MIAGSTKRGGDALEESLIGMFDFTCFSVNWYGGTNSFSSKSLIYALHPETYSENGDFVTKSLNELS